MTSRIHRFRQVANRIAAGEVGTPPLGGQRARGERRRCRSLAGCHRGGGGGLSPIRVIDDGCGMARRCPPGVQRHATSKITTPTSLRAYAPWASAAACPAWPR